MTVIPEGPRNIGKKELGGKLGTATGGYLTGVNGGAAGEAVAGAAVPTGSKPGSSLGHGQSSSFIDLSLRSDFHAYAVKFSPFRPGLVAVASAQYFGMVGNGKLAIHDLGLIDGTAQAHSLHASGPPSKGYAAAQLHPRATLSTKDACYDIAFSEDRATILVAATGDGSLVFWDFESNSKIFS